MSASTRLGVAFRRLGSLVAIGQVRGDDQRRGELHGDKLQSRVNAFADSVEKRVAEAEKTL